MVSKIKPAKDLLEDEINRLYDIYKFAFVEKGIPSRSFDDFCGYLNEPYCYTHDRKLVQLFAHSEGEIEGYTISTEPVDFYNAKISKIIQDAIGQMQKGQRSAAFVKMIQELASEGKTASVNYLAEVGIEFPKVGELFLQAGFHSTFDKDLASDLTRKLLGDHPFDLIEDSSGLIVARKTLFSENYKAILLTNYERRH